MESILFVVIGLGFGWLAGRYVKNTGFGVAGDLITGVAGALIGGLMFKEQGAALVGGLVGSMLIGSLGAISLLSMLRLLKTVR